MKSSDTLRFRAVQRQAGAIARRLTLSLLMVVVAAGVASAGARTNPIAAGTGEQLWGKSQMKLFTYRPSCANPSLLIVMHGLHRNASGYRDHARPLADRHCLLIVAPLFDAETYPSWRYQHGGVVHKGVVQDQRAWTGQIIERLAKSIQRQEGREMPYSVIGHSAGGQFLSRLAAFVPTSAQRIVIANPGSHVFATLKAQAPYGLGGVYSAHDRTTALREYLRRPVTLLLGQEDTGSRDLTTAKEAEAQGKTRYQRGINAYRMAQALAAKHGWEFNWRLVEVSGAGHSARKMLGSAETWEALQP